jgi:glycosyltransferase involved in cell wall biosynthesis
MRIAILGNMNNNFVALTQYLRDAGYDAHLFYIPSADHFRPIADSFEPNHPYYHEVGWLKKHIHGVNEAKVREKLKDFSFFIGQGVEAAIAKKCGINMNIYFPYGSDFYKFAWLPQQYSFSQILFKVLFNKSSYAELKRGTQAYYTKLVIKEAKNVYLDVTNPEYEKKLLDIGLLGVYKHVAMPFVYLPQYQNRTRWDVHWKSNIDDIRAQHDFVLVYHGRHEWRDSKEYNMNEFTTKNTHHLIKGFASFVAANPNAKAALVTIEYGGDVANSKKLISELGIESNVFWLPKMYRKDLMYLLSNADLGSGEFDKSYVTFGTIIETMAMGKPVVHYREDALYKEQYPELYPMYNAREPEQIAQALQEAYANPEARIAKGKQAQAWVKTYFIDRPLAAIIDIIENESVG